MSALLKDEKTAQHIVCNDTGCLPFERGGDGTCERRKGSETPTADPYDWRHSLFRTGLHEPVPDGILR